LYRQLWGYVYRTTAARHEDRRPRCRHLVKYELGGQTLINLNLISGLVTLNDGSGQIDVVVLRGGDYRLAAICSAATAKKPIPVLISSTML